MLSRYHALDKAFLLVAFSLAGCKSYQRIHSAEILDGNTVHTYQGIGVYGEGEYVSQLQADVLISDSALILDVMPPKRQWTEQPLKIAVDSLIIPKQEIKSVKLRVCGSFYGVYFYLPGAWWFSSSVRIDMKDNKRLYVTSFNPKVVKDIKRKLSI
jgi:hypothetical protein